MQFPRRSTTAVTIALVALTWLAAADARAQDFPSRVIRVVVAFPAGGPTDFVARILADRLKPPLGQNVIVENRPGANGAIGADYVAKGEADGHLLFLTTVGAVAVTPHLSKPNYDTLRDFADHAGGAPHHRQPRFHGHFRGMNRISHSCPHSQGGRGAHSRGFPGLGLPQATPTLF